MRMMSVAFVDAACLSAVVGASGWHSSEKYYKGGLGFPTFQWAPLCPSVSVG